MQADSAIAEIKTLSEIPTDLLTHILGQSETLWDAWVSALGQTNRALWEACKQYLGTVLKELCASRRRELVAWKGDRACAQSPNTQLPVQPYATDRDAVVPCTLDTLRVLNAHIDHWKFDLSMLRLGSYVDVSHRFADAHRDTCEVFGRIAYSNCLTLQRYEGMVKHTEARYTETVGGAQECIGPRYPVYGDAFYHFKLPIRFATVYDPTGQSLVSAYYERHELPQIDLDYMDRFENRGWKVLTTAGLHPLGLEWRRMRAD